MYSEPEMNNRHTQPFYGSFSGTTQVSRCQKKKLLLDFMVQGEILEAERQTHRQSGWGHSARLISDPPPSSPIFTPDALPVATLPIYPGLGQEPNMLACIPIDE